MRSNGHSGDGRQGCLGDSGPGAKHLRLPILWRSHHRIGITLTLSWSTSDLCSPDHTPVDQTSRRCYNVLSALQLLHLRDLPGDDLGLSISSGVFPDIPSGDDFPLLDLRSINPGLDCLSRPSTPDNIPELCPGPETLSELLPGEISGPDSYTALPRVSRVYTHVHDTGHTL
jgi:hypothetical protein